MSNIVEQEESLDEYVEKAFLSVLDSIMTMVLFANGQDDQFKGNCISRIYVNLSRLTDSLTTKDKKYTILMEIYEIIDTWHGGWAHFWQFHSPENKPYLGDDPDIKSIEQLMK